MNQNKASPDPTLSDVIKIAILAVGGQGGGVLTNWTADLAAKGGYDVQTTSVAGLPNVRGRLCITSKWPLNPTAGPFLPKAPHRAMWIL